jgi:hypothetical protein
LGGVLVCTTRQSIRACFQRYAPAACSTPREATTGESVTYAPPSITMSISQARKSPCSETAVRYFMIAGWRLVVEATSSSRL